MTALTLYGVSVSLGRGDARTPVLRAVDATCEPGVLTALVGPSGSGKSTLLAVAGALLRPDEGRVLLGGTDLAALTDAERARTRRERIGYLFQSGNLLGGLTAVEQLLAAASVAGRPARRLRAAAESALGEVGLAHRLHHRADRLSGGERQRVALARALFPEPDLLLIDEPTAAVDRTRAAVLTELIATTAHRRHCAALVATHDPVVAEAAGATVAM
ncbi:ATP-binding cassette domain-containing protein [Kitasatospora sp. NA04385]|uniref:ABC transporter ATP-binding protein n=1 Tax=Kitasatospora sp. NA04385 TaxID=2742135 RepID=UPI001590CE9C|nr:ATP-binding cassette domain-containing protein [Kitasatospora sp. NA04385]QKW18492.1 ATP-binding cassette domain-containing protein [Kitasatospora sp. NA04385]